MFKLVTLSALLSAIALVAAGGPEVCTDTAGVSSCVEYQSACVALLGEHV